MEDKHIEWCLKKAEKEIKECKRLGKKSKHRGLVKITPDIEKAKKHIEKAEYYFKTTNYLVQGGIFDVSLGTIFYSMYHCFLGIAAKFGYESGNQKCTVALINSLIERRKLDIGKKYVNFFKYENGSIIELREDYTYGTEINKDKSKNDFFIKEAKDLIDLTKEIIYGESHLNNI